MAARKPSRKTSKSAGKTSKRKVKVDDLQTRNDPKGGAAGRFIKIK